MILPLPVALPAKEGSVRFKNLKEYPDFFDALAKGFPSPPKRSWSRSVEVAASATLEVHDVGDFVASFVPKIADFTRVDPRFVLSPEVWTKLPSYADYGFAVFQLKELSGSPHPIALEFDSRLPEQLFFPTVHIHDGSVHEKDTFDHVLYAQASAFDALELKQSLELLDGVLARMTELQREAFVLCELEQFPQIEVAAMLGINENTLRARLRSARSIVNEHANLQRAARGAQ